MGVAKPAERSVLLTPMLDCSVDLLLINSHYLRMLISVIATRTAACLGYSAAANQRQHCDGTRGPFNQQKLKVQLLRSLLI